MQRIDESKRCHIIKIDGYFILQRKPVHSEIETLLKAYKSQQSKLHAALRLHPADFLHVRLEFFLAKFKTYLGLARVSEFSVTKEQWLEWHEVEMGQMLNELIEHIKQAEHSI